MTRRIQIGIVAAIVLAGAATFFTVRQRQADTSNKAKSPDSAQPEPNADYAHPEAVAKFLFEAFARKNWTEAAKFWPAALPAIDDRVKGALGGLEIVKLDQPRKKQPPFKVGVYDGAWQPGDGDPWVPYEIRFSNGKVQKADLRLSWDGSHWQFAGGL